MSRGKRREGQCLLRLSPRLVVRLEAFVKKLRAENPGEVVTLEDALAGLLSEGTTRFAEFTSRASNGDVSRAELVAVLEANDDGGLGVSFEGGEERSRGAATVGRRAAPSAASLFHLVWVALGELLGTSATAILMRRSVQRVATRDAAREYPVVVRKGLDYEYELPPSWTDAETAAEATLRDLIHELWPILQELTGSVVTSRLRAIDELVRCDMIPAEKSE
ncbi:MAG: hypothetical protein ACAI25_05930 [Planctomycetota bacterium]